MTQANPNVAILQQVYSEWHKTKGDPSVLLDILADEIRWGSAADGKPGMDLSLIHISEPTRPMKESRMPS